MGEASKSLGPQLINDCCVRRAARQPWLSRLLRRALGSGVFHPEKDSTGPVAHNVPDVPICTNTLGKGQATCSDASVQSPL